VSLPTLRAGRLLLRPFTPVDGPVVRRLAGAPEVADTTLTIPHPYPDGAAEDWIATHAADWEARRALHLAIVDEEHGLLGAIGLVLAMDHLRGELGYWVGVPYWGRGIATQAARAVIRFAFEELGLERVYAMHFARNPASGRVLVKAGMRHEGRLHRHVRKGGRFEDAVLYAVLRPRGRVDYARAPCPSTRPIRTCCPTRPSSPA
jgi:RimJ/RimL family protein N-acetyltransferase